MSDRSGVVLAGGHSRRFGAGDKALAELEGEPLLVRVARRVATVVGDVTVSCRPSQAEQFERALSAAPVDRVVTDRVRDAGPLGGIEAGLDVASGVSTAIVACDMPFTDPALLDRQFERATSVEAVVPEGRDGELQPLQAVYETGPMQDAVAGHLPDGGSVHQVLETLDVDVVPAGSIPERTLHNVNTRADLLAAKRR